MPVLMLLGYGEHTLNKVLEQQTYKLADPWTSKGSRRIRLDYEPRVNEEGLWVMEAKGTDSRVSAMTLGQVRDYAIHPEVRAALMVTVGAEGFRVFDPWAMDWNAPILALAINEIADGIEELREVLGVDHVANVVRRRHMEHLERALSASLEFGVLDDAEREFKDLIDDARTTIDARRKEIHLASIEAAEELHEQVLERSGVWGVAQAQNSPWIGNLRDTRDFAVSVLAQDVRQRPTQILQFRPAIEAVFKDRCPEGSELWRPLWWLNVCVLGGSLGLRQQEGCEPFATDAARQAMRDCLLVFPDDPGQAASWRFQRSVIPLACRVGGFAPLEDLSQKANQNMSAEQRIRLRVDPGWFFGHGVRTSVIESLAAIDPWTPEEINRLASEAASSLERIPRPDSTWFGPVTDPWLDSWKDLDALVMCGLAVLRADEAGDDLILADEDLVDAIVRAAESDQVLLRRPAVPLANRLGLQFHDVGAGS